MLFLFSCENGDGSKNIEDFYFPLNNLKEGKIYEYQSVGNKYDPPMFWHYRSEETKETQYLLGTGYGPEFSPDQFVKEEKLSNGMMLVDFRTYEAVDSLAEKIQVRAEIKAGNIFPFHVKQPASVLLTSLTWEPAGQGGAKINLVRNRQYDSDTIFVFNGKNIPAVKFNTIELIEHDEQGRLPLEFNGHEIYAENIGLVELRKNITEEYQLAYELKNIYSIEEFENKFDIKIEK